MKFNRLIMAALSMSGFLTLSQAAITPPPLALAEKAVSQVTVKSAAKTQFFSYWFSWAQANSLYTYPNLRDIPKGVDVVLVAFGLEGVDKNNQPAIVLQNSNDNALKADIALLHQRGTKVMLSSGGATGPYPWEVTTLTPDQIAQQYISFVNDYKFDGIDFDVEAGAATVLPEVVKLIKQQLPHLMITLTISVTTTPDLPLGYYQSLAKQLYDNHTLDHIILMNYDQYWNPGFCDYDNFNDVNNNCYIVNAQYVFNLLATQWGLSQAAASQMLVNGFMFGYADDSTTVPPHKILQPMQLAQLVKWTKDNQWGGVMTWGLNRDQSTKGAVGGQLAYTSGMVNVISGAYTSAVYNALKVTQSTVAESAITSIASEVLKK
jgi:chitinase